MPLLKEDEVYLGAKALLRSQNWILIAGQPPGGCDNLPVVEIKLPGRVGIGSKGAHKPDLIASKNGIFLLVECKPDHSTSDAEKLRGILNDKKRIFLLFQELNQRKLLERRRIAVSGLDFSAQLYGALAHSGKPMQLLDLFLISVSDISGNGRIIKPRTISL